MSSDFSGRTAVVTGGTRGFGRALIDELLARDVARVYSSGRSPHVHSDSRVVPVVLDVTDAEQVAAVARYAGDVDLVINNAGFYSPSPVLAQDLTNVRASLETNLYGLLHVARAFAPALARHDHSSLLSVLSVVSWLSHGAYGISKAAALSATDAIRLELAAQNTTVTALHVGYMDTDMVAEINLPKSNPADIARRALDGVSARDLEVLGDDRARSIKSELAGPVAARYPDLTIG